MLIAARNSFMAGDRPTAKSYVQNGLVAMWDGIENAGWGVHDENATVWKDLVGNRDLTFVNGVTIGDDYAEGGDNLVVGVDPFEYTTIEMVIAPGDSLSLYSQHVLMYSGVSGNSTPRWLMYSKYINRSTYGVHYYRDKTPNAFETRQTTGLTKINCTIIYQDGYSRDVTSGYVNGNIAANTTCSGNVGGRISSFALGNALGRGSGGKWFNCRLYSRALTADEIAANYAIDKERFNLPDATA